MSNAFGLLSDGLPLFRRELLTLGTVTSKSALALMPPGAKGQVRVITGDDSGLLASMQLVKNVPSVSWRKSVEGKLSAVCIGDKDVKGKYTIHYSCGPDIVTIDKESKEISRFATNSTENVRFLRVGNGHLWAAGDYVVNLFDSTGKEVSYGMCADKVLCLCVGDIFSAAALPSPTAAAAQQAVVGCADRQIRVFAAREDSLAHAAVPGPVSAITQFGALLFYGTSNGHVGLLAAVQRQLVHIWSFSAAPTSTGEPANVTYHTPRLGGRHEEPSTDLTNSFVGASVASSGAGITSIAVGTLGSVASGVTHLIVGRDDGSLEFYVVESAEGKVIANHARRLSASHNPHAPHTLEKTEQTVVLPLAPKLVQCLRLEESVQNMSIGFLTMPNVNELIVQTFTGRILSFSLEDMLAKEEKDFFGRSTGVTAKDAHIQNLQKEVEELKRKIQKEKEKAGRSGAPLLGGAGTITATGAPAGPDGGLPLARYDVIHSFVLDPQDASYVLSLEIPALIDSVLLQSSVCIDLVDPGDGSEPGAVAGSVASSTNNSSQINSTEERDTPHTGGTASFMFNTDGLQSLLRESVNPKATPESAMHDSGVSAAALFSTTSKSTSAVISRTPCSPASGVGSLITFRCAEPSNRVQLRLRTIEGQQGELQVFVINKSIPRSATLVKVPIKPLSLHHRVLEPPSKVAKQLNTVWDDFCKVHAEATARNPASVAPIDASFPLGTLTVTGPFTLSQMHEWVSSLLPDVPLRLTAEGQESVDLSFRNVFTGTHLLCNYKKGSATFQSDSPSCLTILKELITNYATALKLRITTNVDLPRFALRHVMTLLHPKLMYILTLQEKAELVDAVREVVATDGGNEHAYLHPDFQDILRNADKYKKQLKMRARMLEYTCGVATDCFIDWHRLKGADVSSCMEQLVSLLQTYHHRPSTIVSAMESGDLNAVPAAKM